MMTIYVDMPDGSTVELIGSNCKHWTAPYSSVDNFFASPDYEGPIENLPRNIIEHLLKTQIIKSK